MKVSLGGAAFFILSKLPAKYATGCQRNDGYSQIIGYNLLDK